MANHKSSKKQYSPDRHEACPQPAVPQDGPQRCEGSARNHREERRRGLLPKVTAMLDKLAKHNIVHKNKAGNLKSAMQLHVNAL